MVEQGVGGAPTPCFLPSHTTVPMGPHPPSTAGSPQGACGLARVPRPTWRMPTAGPTHRAPPVSPNYRMSTTLGLRAESAHGRGIPSIRYRPSTPPTHHAPPRPTGAAHAVHSGAGMVHKVAPTSHTAAPKDSVVRNQVGYIGPRERTSRRDARASQEASHHTAVRTWDRPQSYHTRSWAVNYLY